MSGAVNESPRSSKRSERSPTPSLSPSHRDVRKGSEEGRRKLVFPPTSQKQKVLCRDPGGTGKEKAPKKICENIIESPHKEVRITALATQVKIRKLLRKLLEDNPELVKGGVVLALYWERYSNEVLSIVERVAVVDKLSDAFVSNDERLIEVRKAISKLADCWKALREFEQRCGTGWLKSLCYPVPPDSFDDNMPHLKIQLILQLQKVSRPVLSGMGPYKFVGVASANDMEAYDVVSLLSGVPGGTLVSQTLVVARTRKRIVLERDTFTGKYVFVFCINTPALFGSHGFQSLLNLCYELCTVRDDVEMVMVARMNILADSVEIFYHLFSGFPPSCLAVPYEDWERREHIWKVLKRGSHEIQDLGLLYGTDGSLLTSFCVDGEFEPYGAEAFPFTKRMLEEIKTEREKLRNDRLEKLLRPYESSPDAVFVNELNGRRKENILEVMQDKHIGLYVCCDGDKLIPRLKKLYEQWKDKFEIVVLYLPLLSMTDPDTFKHRIDGLLQKQGIRGWCLPFNNSVSLRFWGLTEAYDCRSEYSWNHKWEDKLIIVGPDAKILDMYGGEVIKMNGGIDMYPFTRAAVVENKMKELRRELRLESLLEGQHFCRGDDLSDVISADALLSSKKKVIIYMGRPGVVYDFEGLVSQYEEMKKREMEGDNKFEVVFVEYPLDGKDPEDDADKFSAMPWYIHRTGDRTYTPLAIKLKLVLEGELLVGFGEDGNVCSVKLLRELEPGAGLTLGDSLYQDIYHKFEFDNYRDI